MAVAGAATAVVLSSLASSSSDEARSGATAAAEEESTPLPVAPSHECAVCLSELPAGAAEPASSEPTARRTLPACGHAFHADCIGRWLPLRPECPLCRRPVPELADGRRQAAAAPAWARPATTIACGFGDGRVVWTRSPSARQ